MKMNTGSIKALREKVSCWYIKTGMEEVYIGLCIPIALPWFYVRYIMTDNLVSRTTFPDYNFVEFIFVAILGISQGVIIYLPLVVLGVRTSLTTAYALLGVLYVGLFFFIPPCVIFFLINEIRPLFGALLVEIFCAFYILLVAIFLLFWLASAIESFCSLSLKKSLFVSGLLMFLLTVSHYVMFRLVAHL